LLIPLQREISLCEDAAAKIRFDKNSFAQHYRVGLFVTGIHKANAVYALLQYESAAEARQILRSSLEILVELELFAQDETHKWNAQVAFAREQLKTLRYAKEGNPNLAEISSKMNIKEQEATWTEKLEQAKQMGGKELTVSEKFRLLKRHHEYEALYASLSKSVHSSYAGVIHDAFDVDHENGRFDVALYPKPSEETVTMIIETACVCLSGARKTVSDLIVE
jgi:hypothetical protein